MAERLALGFLTSALIFAGAIAAVTIAHFRFRLNAVAAFWIAYVLTRPLGASIGDWLSQPTADGGLGLGTTTTSVAFLAAILAIVVYLTISKRDRTERVLAGAAPEPRRRRPRACEDGGMSSRARRRWSALSLRTRLTAVFAAVMVVALGLTGFLVYTQFRQDLDARIDEELVDRQHALTGLVATAPIPQEGGRPGRRAAGPGVRPEGRVVRLDPCPRRHRADRVAAGRRCAARRRDPDPLERPGHR